MLSCFAIVMQRFWAHFRVHAPYKWAMFHGGNGQHAMRVSGRIAMPYRSWRRSAKGNDGTPTICWCNMIKQTRVIWISIVDVRLSDTETLFVRSEKKEQHVRFIDRPCRVHNSRCVVAGMNGSFQRVLRSTKLPDSRRNVVFLHKATDQIEFVRTPSL